MSGSPTPPSSSSPPNAPAEGTATPDTKTTSSSPTPATAAPSSGSNTPPRPQIPPGHSGTIRTPHAHDVLSGRGGRINSHPGNVRFREKVDAYKREYLDPRTKKVEKARIAARIVGTIRCLDPSGRFLKEDPHTGLWMEIGDERAWKKAGQALRESAPEIRAERQAQLQMLVASVSVSGVANAGSAEQILAAEYAAQAATSTATGSGGAAKSSSGGRKSRAADPPGPRHRPKPPEREGLSSGSSSVPPPRSSSRGGEKAVANNKQSSHNNHSRGGFNEADEDAELARMRDEYMQMQRMQAEQQRRMQHYQQQMQHQQAQEQQQQGGSGSGGVMGNNDNDGYGRDVYDEYNQMQQNLMGGYNGNGRSQQQQMAAGSRGGGGASYGQQNSNHQDIAAAIMESDLLPVDAGFVIPALRGDQQQQHQQYAAQYNQNLCQATTNQQPQHTQPYYQEDERDFNNSHSAFDSRHGRQYFPPNNNSSCDKTVSTMSSFDVQSMDMSHTSLGGFSWNNLNASNNMSGMMNNSAYNMSGLISTGSVNNSSGRYGAGNNYHQHGGGGQHRGGGGGGRENKKGKSKSSGKSALERKLEKVNEAHRREIVAMQRQQQMPQQQQQQAQQAHLQSGMHVSVPTQRDQGGQQQQRSRKFSQEHHNHNMSSFNNSFGFEAIEEDDITEASYKMSNLGLSEMDMTFSSDVLSIRSKSVPKMRSSPPEEEEGGGGGDNKKQSSGTLNRRASTEDGNHHHPNNKRSNSDVDGNNVDANSSAPKNINATTVLPAVGPNIFNQSNSSNSATNSSMSKSANKSLNASNFSMDDFNESFKSMEMEDRGGGNGTNGMPPPQQRQMQQRERLPDPDGAVGGTASLAQQRGGGGGGHQHHHHGSSSHSRRNKDPNGGRLPAISSSRASHHDASSGDRHHNPGPSSSNRRESSESMGLSDPDMLTTSTHDFGVSLESLRSFQSQGSDASGWLNQYNSMENIRSDQNPWDDEDQGSEISAPRMVTATGGGGD